MWSYSAHSLSKLNFESQDLLAFFLRRPKGHGLRYHATSTPSVQPFQIQCKNFCIVDKLLVSEERDALMGTGLVGYRPMEMFYGWPVELFLKGRLVKRMGSDKTRN